MSDDATRCRDALLALERGDGSPAGALGTSYGGPGWTALRMAMWFAQPDRFSVPSIEEVGSDDLDPGLQVRACSFGARAALLSFDDELFDRFVVLLESIDGARGSIDYEVLVAWSALMHERAIEPTQLVRSARESRDPRCVIEAHTIASMAHLAEGNIADATKQARTASRIARAEGMSQEEYLPNIVLSRVRRCRGTRHLAVHILGTLRRFAPVQFHPWIDTELCLAGEKPTASVTEAADRVHGLIRAAALGQRAEFDRAARDALSCVAGFAPLRRDLHALVELLDPMSEAESTSDFARGAVHDAPRGLQVSLEDDLSILSYVVAGLGRDSRRVLAGGLALAPEARRIELPAGQRRQVRTESALAVIALQSGSSMVEEDFFAEVYGFAYQADIHQSAFSVLVSRMRQALGDAARVEREGGVISLQIRRPIAMVDPRCEPSIDDRVLQNLAGEGAASARVAAERLGISLRVVQRVLQQLTADGACAAQKSGRVVEYIVEDTTFSEPTRV